MRERLLAGMVALLLIPAAFAGSGLFQRATVVGMDSTDCMKRHRSVRAALSGTSDDKREVCAEYVLTSSTTLFRVQANKSAPLLLPAEEVSFRPGKGTLVVRRDDDSTEFEMGVICMRLRSAQDGSCVDTGDIPKYAASSNRGH